GRAYNSSTGTSVIGQRGAVQNVYTGDYASGGRAVGYNDRTGAVGAGSKVTVGNSYTGNSATFGRGTVYNPNTGNSTTVSGGRGSGGGGYINVNGNVIAGKDGNYYRPSGDGGWDQVTRPNNPGTGVGSTSATGSAARQNLSTSQQQQQWNRVQPSAANQQQLQ